MKLKHIYFDAFKSLLNKELEINHECIGFVGTNESGKSNVLSAINVLGGGRKLTITDSPKMEKSLNPKLRFSFKLDEKETKEFNHLLTEWRKRHTFVLAKSIFTDNLNIIYTITYDKTTGTEKKYFSVDGIKMDTDSLILNYNKLGDSYQLKNGNDFLTLDKAVVIKPVQISSDEKHRDSYKEIEKLFHQIAEEEIALTSLKEELSNLVNSNSNISNQAEQNGTPGVQPEIATVTETFADKVDSKILEDSLNGKIALKHKNLESIQSRRTELINKTKDFNTPELIGTAMSQIISIDLEIAKLDFEITTTNEKLLELQKLPEGDEKRNEIPVALQSIETFKNQLNEFQATKLKHQKLINDIEEPLKDKYTSNLSEIHKHIDSIVQPFFNSLLPKVVFWAHDSNYVLQSATLFSDLISKNNLDEISRPLVNVFRIGLGIKTIDDLKVFINEIQNDPSERSRLARKMTKKINDFIERTWKDYDQSINIALEQERVRIEIFDPEVGEEDAGHYNMEERSQGCQTFLSFLMTIGAEAEHGVLKNNILLLDEPETHLHPSGVRYMLQELIKISERGNLVVYATHSIFLIDRNKFDRHIILKKEKENTILQPANVGRVGYFMQEEVLYRTLDTKLDSDFSFANEVNFVFEGDGDVNLFEFYYDKILAKDDVRPFPIESASFHQGGKCSNIKKYFTQRPIQLGTKWIFILDKDKAGDELKKFIEGRYKNYVNKDIYVYQYVNEKKNVNDIELEDLLTTQFILDSYVETIKLLSLNIATTELNKHISADTLFNKYDDAIIKSLVPEAKKEEFKGKFKEVLNSKIKKQLPNIKNEDTFKNSFPEYHKWITETIPKLTEVD